jgi:Rieske Fe-S protein
MKKTGGLLKHPLWAEEFSIHGAEDKYVLRRQFTKFLVLTSFGMFVGNVWIFVKSLFAKAPLALPDQVVATASEIPVGGVKLFRYPTANDPCILVRTPNQKLVAYSQKCTHLSCAVYYSPGRNRLECPCHEGYFSIDTGGVLQGPPPRPLPKIQLEQRGDQVFAIGVEAQEHGEGA